MINKVYYLNIKDEAKEFEVGSKGVECIYEYGTSSIKVVFSNKEVCCIPMHRTLLWTETLPETDLNLL